MRKFINGFIGLIVHISFITGLIFLLSDVIEWIITKEPVELLYVYVTVGSILGIIFWLYLTGKDD